MAAVRLIAFAAATMQAAFASATTTVIDHGQLKIWLMTDTIARVTFQPESDSTALPPKYYKAVPNPGDWPAVEYTESSEDDLHIIATSGMSISINTTSWRCAFTDLSTGVEVLREGPRSLEATEDSDPNHTPSFIVEQSWERRLDEHIYGGGEYQSGFLERSGAPLEIVQRNTEAALPYFMSTHGYGLLWDNPAKTWLNWPTEELPLTLYVPTDAEVAAGRGEGDGRGTAVVQHVAQFEATSAGRHFFTLHCGGINYGASIPATAQLFLTDVDADRHSGDE